ncbi:integrase [Peteryoungia aggregata LMG 23059]|uniref:Integrase n=1 Tax=Peteryoungia aggregata LMG 23059 TaxID=1368425 RepID=A0ABU0G8N1_9HYPH|nr:DUF6538 domain-containing protein [Peteryoungia aggregata]MDQ0421101.1 integrase [Peteryoungia aggregata LMG 23059]
MAGKDKYLLNRDGRYFARVVIPKELRPFLNDKTELRTPLGPDRRTAQARLHTAVAELQAKIGIAERQAQAARGEAATSGRYPLPADQIALRHYLARLAFDDSARNDHRYANVGIDDRLVSMLREGLAGKLTDDVLETLIGEQIERFRLLGNTTAIKGTDEWRVLARALCMAELEALARAAERDEGDFSGKPESPLLVKALEQEEAKAEAEPEPEFAALTFEAVIAEKVRLTEMGLGGNKKSDATLEKYRQVVLDFEHFRRSKRVATVTLEEGEAWRDSMLNQGKLSRKSIRDKLAAIRAILSWAQDQCKGKLYPDAKKGTPFDYLELPVADVIDSADRTYSLDEARKVLEAARLETKPNFRWLPWLLAHSGMRIGEALQLEKADVFEVQGDWFMHIRVGEGRRTKTNKARKVPVHPALIEEGFIEFVKARPAGKLFEGTHQDQRLREWVREVPLKGQEHTPPPNHGFRHLFEDALFGGVNEKAALYIMGRSSGSSADDYGGSDLRLMELAIQMKKVRPILG